MRTFLAMEIPDEIKRYLQTVNNTLSNHINGVKWVKSEGQHITLKFFGEIEEPLVWKLKDNLEYIGLKHSPFTLCLNQIDAFPSKKKARVIVVSLENGIDNIKEIFNDIEDSVYFLGIEKDERGFKPHITLGRNRIAADITDRFISIEKKSFDVDAFELFKSTLTSHGAIYTTLWKINLSKRH